MSFKLRNRILPVALLTLVIIQVVFVLMSWIVSSAFPSLSVRSLLGSEGIRWFLGNFTTIIGQPLLMWLLLCSVAYGAFVYSGLQRVLKNIFTGKALSYRQRHALFSVLASLAVVVVTVILLAFVPHAPLLGVAGGLFPSAFCSGLIPIITFTVTLLSVVYGLTSGQMSDLNHVFRCLYVGIFMFAPLFPIYILGVQLYASVIYAFFS